MNLNEESRDGINNNLQVIVPDVYFQSGIFANINYNVSKGNSGV